MFGKISSMFNKVRNGIEEMKAERRGLQNISDGRRTKSGAVDVSLTELVRLESNISCFVVFCHQGSIECG